MTELASAASQGWADWLPALLMVLGVIALGILVALMARSARSASHASQPHRAALQVNLEQAEQARHQLEEARIRAAELIGSAQRLASRIDDKVGRLEEVLTLVEQRLGDYEAAALGEQGHAGSAPAPPRAVETKPIEPLSAPSHQFDPLTSAVYNLADRGRKPVEIAGELNEQIGKVELILALRRSLKA